MSRFYGSVMGQARTEATRRGSANSGVTGHVRGWHVGVETVASAGVLHSENDVLNVFATAGSTGSGPTAYIGTVYRNASGALVFQFNGNTYQYVKGAWEII